MGKRRMLRACRRTEEAKRCLLQGRFGIGMKTEHRYCTVRSRVQHQGKEKSSCLKLMQPWARPGVSLVLRLVNLGRYLRVT